MRTPEGPRGLEALRVLSFRDVTIRPDAALSLLTQKTRAVARKNYKSALNYATANVPDQVPIIQGALRNMNEIVTEGGLSIGPELLTEFYDGRNTFRGVIDAVNTVITERLDLPYNPNEREPGIMAIGYYLDLLRILDPRVAGFENGVDVIMQSLRTGRYFPPMALGAMIDDTVNKRSQQSGWSDAFADAEGANQFRRTVLRIATPLEREHIKEGISVPKIAIERALMRVHPERN